MEAMKMKTENLSTNVGKEMINTFFAINDILGMTSSGKVVTRSVGKEFLFIPNFEIKVGTCADKEASREAYRFLQMDPILRELIQFKEASKCFNNEENFVPPLKKPVVEEDEVIIFF